MPKETQGHQAFGSVIISTLITLIIVGCGGFIFYTITSQQQPQQEIIQAKLVELRSEIEDNKALQEKINDLEEKIAELEGDSEDELTKENTIDPTNWATEANSFFKLLFKHPLDYTICYNTDCTAIKSERNVDFWNVFQEQKDSEAFVPSLQIYPRINGLEKLAIEFGQDMFTINQDAGYVVEGSDAIGIFDDQLAFQFDVVGEFIEDGVKLLPNETLVLDESALTESILLEGIHRVIYFDFDGLIYRVIYPIENPTINEIVNTITFEPITPDTKEVE